MIKVWKKGGYTSAIDIKGLVKMAFTVPFSSEILEQIFSWED